MIGIVVQLMISWLLLKFVEHQNLGALGFKPTTARIRDFVTGLFLPMVFLTLFLLSVSCLVKNPYRLNPAYNLKDFCRGTAYVLRAVAFEELLFRGALLYIMIKHLGPRRAIFISAAAFGVYHWFSYGVLGQPISMLIIFLLTGAAGCVFAFAFVKTRSMYLPFALHFGYDFASMILFSQDKGIGLQLLIKTFEKDPASPGSIISILVMAVHFAGFPVLGYLYLRWKREPENSLMKRTFE